GLVAVDVETWTADAALRQKRDQERLGWRSMGRKRSDLGWDRYEEKVGSQWFRTPTPSITWDVSAIYLYRGTEFTALETDLSLKMLAALQRCTARGEELYALDWNHPCYFFDPHAGVADARAESWAVSVLPNGDQHHFLAQDFRFGI